MNAPRSAADMMRVAQMIGPSGFGQNDLMRVKALISDEYTRLRDDLLVTQKIIDGFAESVGDHNPVHVDEDLAAGQKTIAHGMWAASISAGCTQGFDPFNFFGPAFKCWVAKMEASFHRPIGVGKTVACYGRVAEVSEAGKTVIVAFVWRTVIGANSLAAEGTYTLVYSRKK